MFADSGHGGEFGGHLPDPGGGFAFGAACGVCGKHGRHRGFDGGCGCGLGVAESWVIVAGGSGAWVRGRPGGGFV